MNFFTLRQAQGERNLALCDTLKLRIVMFDNLLDAEQKLLEACQKGEELSLSKKRPSKKTAKNTITGAFLRQLILSSNHEIEVSGNKFILKVDPNGISFSGAYVSGSFDFSFCETYLPFQFTNSTFENVINLSDSKIRFLSLHGSGIPSMNAQGVICESDIFLRQKFEANGIVDFISAQIGGSLDCTNGKFTNEDGNALNCNSVKIQGSVFLQDGFESVGEVNFLTAQIGGNLICANGKFSNENGDALNCNGSKIQGGVFLNMNFEANGEVDFGYTEIGRNLECTNGKFSNENGDALNCYGSEIQGNVFLDDGFDAKGEVDFGSAQIEKRLIFSNLNIVGNCILTSAKVDNINEVEKFWEKDGFGNLYLDGLEYNHLSGENLDSSTLKKWLEKMPEFMPQPYKQLAKVLRNMGHNRDADEIMIEYNHIITEKSDNKFIIILKRIYGKTAGYGYKPMRVLKTMAIILVLCGTFFWGVSKVAVFAPSDPLIFQKKEFYECNVSASGTPISSMFHWSDYNSSNNWTANTKLDGEYSTFSPYWYSLDILLPIVDLQMDKDWGQFVPSDGVTLNHVTRLIVWIEILLGWIFSLILVAILSGLAKNEKD